MQFQVHAICGTMLTTLCNAAYEQYHIRFAYVERLCYAYAPCTAPLVRVKVRTGPTLNENSLSSSNNKNNNKSSSKESDTFASNGYRLSNAAAVGIIKRARARARVGESALTLCLVFAHLHSRSLALAVSVCLCERHCASVGECILIALGKSCCSASVVVVPRIAPLVSSFRTTRVRNENKNKNKKNNNNNESETIFNLCTKINGIGENYYTIIIEVPCASCSNSRSKLCHWCNASKMLHWQKLITNCAHNSVATAVPLRTQSQSHRDGSNCSDDNQSSGGVSFASAFTLAQRHHAFRQQRVRGGH